MIELYSGTPGSGKSLDVARVIYYQLKLGKMVVCNFPIDENKVSTKKNKKFIYLPNNELTVKKLVEISLEKSRKEGEILLIIDESQILFNAREWGKKDRSAWNEFFTQHRKLGYDIILVAQFDQMLDKQIRALIEYEIIHRKIKNLGLKGWLLLPFGSFIRVKIWYPMKEKIDSEFFHFNKKYACLYDTNKIFEKMEE